MLRFQFVADAWPLIASLVVCAALAALAFRSRRGPMVPLSAWFFVAVCWVTFCHFLEVVTIDAAARVFWMGLQVPGIAACLALMAAITLVACDRGNWLERPPVRFTLWGFVVLLTALAWSNPNHDLFWRISQARRDSTETTVAFGWLGYVVLAVGALGLVIVVAALGRQAFASAAANRPQAQLLTAAAALPLLASVLELLAPDPFPLVANGILLLCVSSALLAAAVFAYGEPDLEEVAREIVVETIQAPIVLLDESQHVIELNPFAERLLDTESSRASGRPVTQLWTGWPTDLGAKSAFEVSHSKLGVETYYSAQRTLIKDRAGVVKASVIVLLDITSRKRNEEHLAEQALRDPLTGIMNRRSFFDHAESEYRRARRRDHSLCVLVIDIDQFKELNERHGAVCRRRGARAGQQDR